MSFFFFSFFSFLPGPGWREGKRKGELLYSLHHKAVPHIQLRSPTNWNDFQSIQEASIFLQCIISKRQKTKVISLLIFNVSTYITVWASETRDSSLDHQLPAEPHRSHNFKIIVLYNPGFKKRMFCTPSSLYNDDQTTSVMTAL